MQLVEKHIINSSNPNYTQCDKLCLLSKNLYNQANYIIRQEFINTSKEKEAGLRDYAIYLNYFDIRRILINKPDYTALPRKVSNQTLMLLDKNWKSFFKAIKDYNKNKSKYTGRPKLPQYLDITTGRYVAVYEQGSISKKDLKKGLCGLSGTNIKIPTTKQNIKQCRIVPKCDHYVIEVVYEVNEIPLKTDNSRYCGIDLGVNNLATIGSNVIEPIIINGKPLKSINQYYNKKLAEYKSKLGNVKKSSKKITNLTNKRNRKIDDYLHKGSRYIVNHLVSNDINTLVIGKNKGWKEEVSIGRVNNQNFVNIPHSTFIHMIEYKAKLVGINVIITEESYTSKCSFLDGEEMKKHEVYLGERVKRGLFKSSKGRLINADLNGSYNIIRKVVPEAFVDGIEGLSVNPILVKIGMK